MWVCHTLSAGWLWSLFLARLAVQIECIRGNILGCINLADVCTEKDVHMTYFGTGCIFHYDDEFTVGSGKVWPATCAPAALCVATSSAKQTLPAHSV